MILLDLVIAGVGRFAQPTKFSFHKGYTVFLGLNETGKSAIARCAMAVLFPEVYSQAPDFINWQLTGTSRAYITLKEGNDVYRLTRDFSQKLSNLARYVPDKKTFALISKDEKEISDFLTEKLGFFDEEIYSSVFFSDFLNLPSTNPFGVTGAVPRPVSMTAPSASAGTADGDEEDPDELKERLGVLRGEMDRAKKIDLTQGEMDDLNGKLYEIQSKMKEVKDIEAKLLEVNEFFDRSKALGDISGIKSRMDRYLDSEKRKEAQLNEIKSRRGQAEAELMNASLPSLKDNKFLLPGGGIALGCIVLTLFRGNIAGLAPESYTNIIDIVFKIVTLGILVGLGVVAWGVWQFINAQNYLQGLRTTVSETDIEMKQVQARFESETKDFKEVMKSLGSSSVEELRAKLASTEQLTAKKNALDQKYSQLVKEHNYKGLIEEEERIKTKIKETETVLESIGGVGYTHQEMKDEIRRIESILKKKGIQVSSIDDPKGGKRGFGIERKSSRFPNDHFSRLIAVATELVQKGKMEPLGELQKEFDKYVQLLSNNNYARSSISKEGVIKFLRGDNLMRVGLESMSPAAKDSMYFALKFALIGCIIKRRPLPIILDDPFLLIDDKRLAMVLGVLKEYSAKTQVIHLTSRQAAVKSADLSVQIT